MSEQPKPNEQRDRGTTAPAVPIQAVSTYGVLPREPKYTHFIPKWKREGRDMGEFPPIGVPDEVEADQVGERDEMKSIAELEAEVARLRGAIREFVDGSRADLEEAKHEARMICIQAILWPFGVIAGFLFANWLWG